jgi:hypothetical protein
LCHETWCKKCCKCLKHCEARQPVTDEVLHEEVCKILGRAETNGDSFGLTAGKLINFIVARAARAQEDKPHD